MVSFAPTCLECELIKGEKSYALRTAPETHNVHHRS